MRREMFCLLFLFFFLIPLSAEQRSFDAVFPALPEAVRAAAFSSGGYIHSQKSGAQQQLIGKSGQSGIDPQIVETTLAGRPGFLVESLLVIPGKPEAVTLLDVYNALGNIRGLKGRLYHSYSRNEDIPLFEDATRLESAKKTNPILDPAPAASLPSSETVYIRLKDVNFGNSYYRGEMRLNRYGLRYSLSNNRNLSYLFVTVIKEEKFTAQFYFEPVQEGILIYSIAGADVSDFVSGRIDMPSAISKRLAVITSWVADGIGKAASSRK